MNETLPSGPVAAPGPDLVPDPQAQAHRRAHSGSFDKDGLGLSLSGGGYKAAAYHLGGLVRLNELGLLRRIDRLASVSGGSITSAYLAAHWSTLTWSADGVASNFMETVFSPLHAFLTRVNIDIPEIALGILLPFRSGADGLEHAYRKHLFGDLTLQDLPAPSKGQAPLFILLATNYELNSLWRFMRPYAADWRVGSAPDPTFPLARIVAASSGFPPFFCPIKLELPELRPLAGADRAVEPYTERALLCDGGVYDNMGIEPIWKEVGTMMISNAGDPLDESPHTQDWLSLMQRIVGMIHRQAENNRVREFMAMAKSADPADRRHLVYWPLRNSAGRYPKPSAITLTDADLHTAQHESVRLWSLKPAAFNALVRHGYTLADSATASYPVAGQLAAPAKLPI